MRRGSQYREAPEHHLDRNDLARLRFKLKALKQRAFDAGESIPKGLADTLEGFPTELNRGDSQRVRDERFFVH